MKLHKFHVCHAATCAPGHGDAVTGADVRVGGIQVNFARATGSRDRVLCRQCDYFAGLVVEHIRTQAAVWPVTGGLLEQFVRGDEVDRDMVFKDGNVWMLAHAICQRGLYCLARRVSDMHHAPVAMATFAGQVQAIIVGFAGEIDALL